MAYVLGVIATDGCLVEYGNGYHGFDITSKDKILLKQIKKTMQAEHKIGEKERGSRLQVRNRKIYSDLLRLGLTPRKSRTIKFLNIPKKYLSDFVRGCFDGDGCVKVWQEPRWRHTWQISTFFCSASLPFLQTLHNQLQSKGRLLRGWIWHGPRSYYLCFAIEDSLRLFNFMYQNDSQLYLKRKKDKFESFISLRK
ncbi:hypothetical protein ACFL1I_06145 [Candidatus Omnitrophota bacterium]